METLEVELVGPPVAICVRAAPAAAIDRALAFTHVALHSLEEF